jgi:hypothetical protein
MAFVIRQISGSCKYRVNRLIPMRNQFGGRPRAGQDGGMSGTVTWLLDGWLGAPWRMERMRRRLEAHCGCCQVWNYDTSGKTSIEVLAGAFGDHLVSQGAPVRLVGFSMGGLVVREVLRQRPDLAVQKAVCLNSPHRGTVLAHLLNRPALCEMRPGSAFLQRLNESAPAVPLLYVWCPGDLIVIPGHHARKVGDHPELCCRMPAHIWPVVSGAWHREIAGFLGR